MRSLLSSRAACILVLAGCAAGPTDRTAPPIIGGAPSTDETVVAVIHTAPGGSRQLCSGVVVGPALVLTAKHCVFEDEGGDAWAAIPPDDLRVELGESIDSPSEERDVTAITTTEGPYHDGDGTLGGDLALLTLSSTTSISPARVSASAPSQGLALRIVGFGATEPESMGAIGARYEGTASVVSVTDGTFTTEGVSWTCSGDSGGPAFRVDDGTLVGVTSNGPRGCPPSASVYTRLDANLALLEAAGVPIARDEADASLTDSSLDSDGGASLVDAGPAPAAPTSGCSCQAGTPDELGGLGFVALVLAGALARARRRQRAKSMQSPNVSTTWAWS